MVANKHLVLSHKLVGFLIHVAGEGNGVLLTTSCHWYSEEIGVELVHMCGRRVLLGFQRSIIDLALAGLGVGAFAKRWPHSIGLTYNLSTGLSGSLAPWTSGIVRLGGCLAYSGGPTIVDESKTHLFLSPFFKYISGLKVHFNAKVWSFHPNFCFAGT